MSKRTAVVWNPSKTDRRELEQPLIASLDPGSDVSWFETSVEDPGQGAAARALATAPDLLLVAGGDGTVRAVAEHLAEARAGVDLGIVPLGTGNLLARNLGVPLNDIPAAVERALTGDGRPVDVGWVDVDLEHGTERHAFVVMIGFGIDAHMIAETDDDLKDKAGWLAYVESLGRAVAATDVLPFRLAIDDGPSHDEEGHTLLVANCGTLQGGLALLPDADPADGELDFVLLSAEGLAQWLGTLKTMVWDNGLRRMITGGEASDSDTITHGRAQKLHVSLPEARAFEVDGEEIGDATGITVEIQPSALRVR
ncbi:diacylglycerol kinase family protein [Agromyces sp. CF514]|uniref:diacylglycerol/lipid kinase family protein n=1 Tax=Agromyces sp. CF514 TaxID=1881031 RepID=UPI000B876B26|nr:diacylglycerol kinase family protein [Agromyces sp. CF514]